MTAQEAKEKSTKVLEAKIKNQIELYSSNLNEAIDREIKKGRYDAEIIISCPKYLQSFVIDYLESNYKLKGFKVDIYTHSSKVFDPILRVSW